MTTSSPDSPVRRRRTRRSSCALIAIGVVWAGSIAAQPASGVGADAGRASTDLGEIDNSVNDAPFEGRVAAYLLSPDAGVAGLIFDDGRQVSVPPHLGPALASLIQPGQQARLGPRRDDLRGPGSVRSITAIATGRTLADEAPDERRAVPRAAGGGLQPLQAVGTIRLRLHGPRGEINGLLLDTGAQVFFPPRVANEAGSWLKPGNFAEIDGYGVRSNFGTAIQATRMAGPGGQTVTVYSSVDAANRNEAEPRPTRRAP